MYRGISTLYFLIYQVYRDAIHPFSDKKSFGYNYERKKELGEKIKIQRKNNNLTQEKLAELIGINQRNLAAIEQCENFIKIIFNKYVYIIMENMKNIGDIYD